MSETITPIVLTADNPRGKLKEITDRLEAGIKELFESEQYKTYLKTLSKFHNYSFNNCLLIAMQKPDATHVAGYSSWRDNFKRNVMKGEKGIKILAPSPYKMSKEQERIDAKSGSVVIGADGNPVKDTVEVTLPSFKIATVFDVSQTEGEPLPEIGVNELTGSVDKYYDFLEALKKSSPVPIEFEDITSGAKGYYDQTERRIAICAGMSELQTLKTAIHEIAHARLHHIDKDTPKDVPRPDRDTREVEAESVAYTVCQHYGLDTSDYSFAYIATWSGARELDALKASLDTIRKEADAIINEANGHLAELTRNREDVMKVLQDEVGATLQMFVDNDLKSGGELSAGTLKAIAVQGYQYKDGVLMKQPDFSGYGYFNQGMVPMERQTALSRYDAGHEVYMLYPDNTEAAATSREEIEKFDGYFGVEKPIVQERSNPLKTAEMSTEQNLNMIDGVLNNTPTVAELEAKARSGEPISLADLAGAIKAERNVPQEAQIADRKPSIREQLAAGKQQLARENTASDKTVKPHSRESGERV